MRVGAEDRVGRGPSNISMMIIRPPQHGHRRAGKGSGGGFSVGPNRRPRVPAPETLALRKEVQALARMARENKWGRIE